MLLLPRFKLTPTVSKRMLNDAWIHFNFIMKFECNSVMYGPLLVIMWFNCQEDKEKEKQIHYPCSSISLPNDCLVCLHSCHTVDDIIH